MTPRNPLETVRRLAADETKCYFYAPVEKELRARTLDSDDLLEILMTELGEVHCYKSEATMKHYPGTMSDYYSIWIDVCGCRMFIKLFVNEIGTANEQLVVTSFKKDDSYDD